MDGITLVPHMRMMKGPFERRLVLFLLFSIALHLIFLLFFPRKSFEPLKQKNEPILVDLMEFTEPLSSEPASLSPDRNPATQVASIPSRPSQRPSFPSPDTGRKERERKPPTEKLKKKDVFKDPDKEPVPAERKVSVPEVAVKPSPSPKPRDLPSLQELIPSVQRLLALEGANRSLYEHFSLEQDGRGELPARVQFNEYLAELKRRVERNWRVSRDYYMVDGSTVLLIVINADGTLRAVDQLKSSGMATHDFETVAAVRQSFPFRPPSKDLLNEQGLMLIRFTFHYIVRPVL